MTGAPARLAAVVVLALAALPACSAHQVSAPPPATAPASHGPVSAPRRDVEPNHAGPAPVSVASVPVAECASLHGGAESAALLDKACDGGDGAGCFESALRLMCGAGVPRDLHKAGDRAARACERGTIESCGNAGILILSLPDATPAEIERGARALEKGCAADDNGACNNLAIAKLQGVGVAKDEAAALSLFEKLCKRGNLNSCGNAGYLYFTGLGVAKDEDRGVALAKPACEKDDPISCNLLGYAYMNGYGGDAMQVLAAPMFEKACKGGNVPACDNLGVLYAAGRGIGQDLTRAEALFRTACNGGNAPACTHLAKVVEQREPVSPATAWHYDAKTSTATY